MLHAPDDVDAPALRLRLLVADTLEGNADLDLVPVFREPSLRLELMIGVEIGSLPVGKHPVALHAKRVDGEEVCAPAVVERVEEELNVVVAADAVAIGVRRVHRAVRLERADAYEHRVVGIHHQHFG
jgi:hypothetical protein